MTSSNGNIFRVTGTLCGEFTGHRWIHRTKTSDAELWCVFFDHRLNKRLSKQSRGWWFETPSGSLWRHYNVTGPILITACPWSSHSSHRMKIYSGCLIETPFNLSIEFDLRWNYKIGPWSISLTIIHLSCLLGYRSVYSVGNIQHQVNAYYIPWI